MFPREQRPEEHTEHSGYGNTDRRYPHTFSLRRMIWSILSSLCKSSVSSVLFRALYPSGQHFNSFNCAILFIKVRNSPKHKVRTAVTSHSHRNVSARMERLQPAIQREHFRWHFHNKTLHQRLHFLYIPSKIKRDSCTSCLHLHNKTKSHTFKIKQIVNRLCFWHHQNISTKLFVSPEGAACHQINCLQWCHSVAHLHYG